MTGDAMRDVIAIVQCPSKRAGSCADTCIECAWKAESLEVAITAAPASARLALARAITPDTHAVVPVEATDAMVNACIPANVSLGNMEAKFRIGAKSNYRAMIAAARKEG